MLLYSFIPPTLARPAAAPPTMHASSSTFDLPRASPRSGSGFPKRLSTSPLSNGHTAGTFVSPSMDNLVQDSPRPKHSRPRRKTLSWNLRLYTNRNSTGSSIGLIPPLAELEKANSSQVKALKTPWYHGWKIALFGTCTHPTYYSLLFATDPSQISMPSFS